LTIVPASPRIRPRRVKLLYLDQRDISNLANARVPREHADALLEAVNDGRVGIVVSAVHAVETALCSDKALRERIIDFVERLRTRRWLRRTMWIEQEEVKRCFVEDVSSCRAAPIQPFTSGPLEEVRDSVAPAIVVGEWDAEHEFGCAVNLWHKKGREKAIPTLWKWKTAWPGWSLYSRLTTRGRKVSDYVMEKEAWKLVPDRTSTGLLLSQKDRREYIGKLDLARCPALALSLQVEDRIHDDVKAHAGTGDIPDIMHLCAVPYCDMTTLDKRMHSIVLQTAMGKVFRDRVADSLPDALLMLGLNFQG
jgi:hypothetical protein